MGGGGRGAGTAPCACQLRYVSVPGHILSSAQYACARGPRGDVRGEGRLGGLGGAGRRLTRARSDARSAEAARSTAPAARAGRGRAGTSNAQTNVESA